MLAGASAFGILAVALWGKLDRRVDSSKGVEVTIFLLGAALWCCWQGRFIPEGRWFITGAIFSWFITLASSIDWRRKWHK
jgi:hypothetical protein